MTLVAKARGFVPVAILSLFGTFSMAANPIFVSNFSFETLPVGGLPNDGCGTGCFYSTGAIPGWTGSTATSGQFQPGTQLGNTTYFGTLSDGNTSTFTNGPILTHTVIPTVQLGVIYTFMVDLGRRKDSLFLGAADLLINGNRILATGTAPTSGNWSTFTATYTGLSADINQPITIELRTTGFEANFDNVRLSNNLTGIPEPAGVTLLGLGLVGLAVFSRRKRASYISEIR